MLLGTGRQLLMLQIYWDIAWFGPAIAPSNNSWTFWGIKGVREGFHKVFCKLIEFNYQAVIRPCLLALGLENISWNCSVH